MKANYLILKSKSNQIINNKKINNENIKKQEENLVMGLILPQD